MWNYFIGMTYRKFKKNNFLKNASYWCVTAIILGSKSTYALAQEIPSNAPGHNIVGFDSFLSSREMVLSVLILIFGISIIVIQYRLLAKVVDKHITEVFKIFTVTLIIVGTLLLIASGFSSDQIAPALGLFGTIAGYILAKSSDSVVSRESKKPQDSLLQEDNND